MIWGLDNTVCSFHEEIDVTYVLSCFCVKYVMVNAFLKIITMYINMYIVTPKSGKSINFIFFMPFYIVNITASVSILSFSLNNEMLRETHYLYDNKTKHNSHCKRYNGNGVLTQFPKTVD